MPIFLSFIISFCCKILSSDDRVETQRRSSRGNMEFAFGSSAPRMMEPRVDSASGYWGTRR